MAEDDQRRTEASCETEIQQDDGEGYYPPPSRLPSVVAERWCNAALVANETVVSKIKMICYVREKKMYH